MITVLHASEFCWKFAILGGSEYLMLYFLIFCADVSGNLGIFPYCLGNLGISSPNCLDNLRISPNCLDNLGILSLNCPGNLGHVSGSPNFWGCQLQIAYNCRQSEDIISR